MSASTSYRSIFTKKNLINLYYSNVRYRSAVGIDRVNTKSFENLLNQHIDTIYRKTNNKTYKFTQYREKLLSRGPYKHPRVISIPTIRDKIVLKALFGVIQSIYESGPFLHELVNKVIGLYISRSFSGFIRIDVKDFYPSIKHNILVEILERKIKSKKILYLIDAAIKTATASKATGGYKKLAEIGVPQGLSISNILANIYMMPIDNKYDKKQEYAYFRYVDDILILCEYNEQKSIQDEIFKDLVSIGLEVHGELEEPSKVTYGRLSDGFIYLGYKFFENIVTVREKSISSLQESIIKIFTGYKYSKSRGLKLLQWVLNLRITGCIFNRNKYGWLFFFSQINDLNLLFRLDNFVEKLIKRFGIDKSLINIKKFIRAYHEITKNLSNSKYIPNFDNYTIKDKRRILNKIFNVKTKLMLGRDIEYQFNKRIYRTVKDLERDLARPS